MQTIQNAIGGKLVTSTSTRTQPVFNPATGEAIATLPLSTLDEINAAVASAKQALPKWASRGFDSRRVAIFRMTRRFRMKLAETLNFFHRQCIAGEMQ